jgi:hypothetical protein
MEIPSSLRMVSAFSFISGVSLACVIAVFAICYFPSLFVLYFFCIPRRYTLAIGLSRYFFPTV